MASLKDESKQAYDDLNSHTYRYVVYKINLDGATALVDIVKKGDPDATYEDYLSHFAENEVRFGLFDFEWDGEDGKTCRKLALTGWFPPSANMREKMLYAPTFEDLKKNAFGPVQHRAEYTTMSELEASYNKVLEIFKSG